jgi:mRNA-degrading endonuclease RelE of RelBE toxin-antitoxin system
LATAAAPPAREHRTRAVRDPVPARSAAGHSAAATRDSRRRGAGILRASLAVNPHRVDKPLFGPHAGCHGARRGTYRIVYRIDEANRTVHVLDIDHRAEIYLHGPCAGR